MERKVKLLVHITSFWKEIEVGLAQENETLNNCIICFNNKPDAVLMNCGHGGKQKY